MILLMAGPCLSEDCRFLKRDPLELRDRQVFFQTEGMNGWAPLDGAQADLANRPADFAYVIRESIDPARSGVVILKSARARQLDEPSVANQRQNVRLVRRADAFDNKTCGRVPNFGEMDIPAKSYDRYHDEGGRVSERGVLRAFHIRYAARKEACHITDDGTQDSIVPWDPRSNRAQFSFDPAVVSGGAYSQTLAWIGATKSYASSANLAEQRVEVRQYHVDVALPTCVRFRLSTVGRGSFLRINDLEDLIASGLSYTRAKENEWRLSP
jgi:hypothetical protein